MPQPTDQANVTIEEWNRILVDMRRPNDVFLDWAGHAPQWQLVILTALLFGSAMALLVYTSGRSGWFAIVVGYASGTFVALSLGVSAWVKSRAERSKRRSAEDRSP
jgi:VanZ family protein